MPKAGTMRTHDSQADDSAGELAAAMTTVQLAVGVAHAELQAARAREMYVKRELGRTRRNNTAMRESLLIALEDSRLLQSDASRIAEATRLQLVLARDYTRTLVDLIQGAGRHAPPRPSSLTFEVNFAPKRRRVRHAPRPPRETVEVPDELIDRTVGE